MTPLVTPNGRRYIGRVRSSLQKPYKTFLLPTEEPDGRWNVNQANCSTYLALLRSLNLLCWAMDVRPTE